MVAADSFEPTAEGTDPSDLTINDVATGALLQAFKVPVAFDIALDWGRRGSSSAGKSVAHRATSPGTTSIRPCRVEHVIDEGLSPVGSADLAYDETHTRLGVNGSTGFQAFDAATMTPPPGIAVVHAGTQQGPVRFLDPNQVLLATAGAGPVSRWDLSGTSSLASPDDNEFDHGVAPAGYRHRLLGSSTVGTHTTVTVLDAARRPLGPPIPVTPDVASLPPAVQSVARKLVPVACVDSRTGRIATVSLGTGDVVIYASTAPFRELSRALGIAAGLATPGGCTWRPDGRQIAIGTYPQAELGGTTSVALYDLATKSLRSTHPVPNLLIPVSLVYRADSKVLWASGPSGSTPDVFELTDLDGRPRIRTAIPGAEAIAVDAARRLVVVTGNMVRRYNARTLHPLGPPLEVRDQNTYNVSPAPAGGEVVLTTTAGWRLVDLDAERTLGPEMPMPSLGIAVVRGPGPVVSASGAGAARAQWNLAPARVRAAACSLAGRNLTAVEWHRYLPDAGPRHRTCPQYPLG